MHSQTEEEEDHELETSLGYIVIALNGTELDHPG